MPLDTFICGNCQGSFNDIQEFVNHKKEGCQLAQSPVNTGETIQIDASECAIVEEPLCMNSVGIMAQVAQATVLNTNNPRDTKAVLIITDTQPQVATSQMVLEAIQESGSAEPVPTPAPVTTGKRRGRPRKGEEKNVQRDAVPKKPDKLPLPEKGKDGKFHCSRCKKAFPKERYFITHKCLASSDYVDISKKEVVKIEGDESEEEDQDWDADDDDDRDEYRIASSDDSLAGSHCAIHVSTDPDLNGGEEKVTDHIQDIPVFNTEEEKAAFEQSLNIDLSGVDHMFRVHIIDQDLNENAPSAPRHPTSGLSLYSCNTCDKVFKTLSHMRLHCLIHTDLKPFKCSKCSYTSNSKGNLYTHMRKHTGQFYTCGKCGFRTVNKSHLLEHEATHSNVRHQCELCKKDYNTVKSLVNHIRKYHCEQKKGLEYLGRFLQSRQDRGTTVIHQCHVCNRKFKKKIDRDRHLFVHDIKDIPSIQHCDLCDYSASRRIYLEKHFLKHRVIYRCSLCQEKFLSTVRLIEHISVHIQDESTNKRGVIFEDSISNSLYLPEPDDAFLREDKEFDNLPPELSASAMNDKSASESMDLTCDDETSELPSVPGDGSNNPSPPSDHAVDLMPAETTSCSIRESTPKETEAGFSDCKDQVPEKSEYQTDETPMDTAEAAEKNVESELASQSITAELASSSQAEGESDLNNNNNNDSASNSQDPGGEFPNISEENEQDEAANTSLSGSETKLSYIVRRLGYRPLTMEIFHKMRQTFGNEECEYCGRLFYSRADYEPHVRTHTGDKPFQCLVCDYRAITRDNLKRHTEREHEKVTFPCKECEFVATSRTQLWNHQLKHRGISGLECPQCHEKFDHLKRLRNHILLKHADLSKEEIQRITGLGHRIQRKMGRRSYKCPYCDRVFIRANSELQKHIWIHEGIKPYKCPLCPHACRSKNNLQAHMLRHSSEKPFICGECGKAYKSKTALRWHIRSHKDGKLFKCEKCPYEASQRSHLKRHMETHNIIKRFICQHCDYSSNTLGYMKLHYTRNHKGLQYTSSGVVEKTMPADSRVYRCLSCDYLFGNLSDLKRHLKIRHHVHVQDIQTLENTTASELFLQVTDDSQTVIAEEANELPQNELDEKTVSAVNILQQIIDMSQQGAFGQQQITVQSDSGQMVTVNPETIIVQEEGQEVVVSEANQDIDGSQYVIQYVASQDATTIETPVEVSTVGIEQHIDDDVVLNQAAIVAGFEEQQVVRAQEIVEVIGKDQQDLLAMEADGQLQHLVVETTLDNKHQDEVILETSNTAGQQELDVSENQNVQ